MTRSPAPFLTLAITGSVSTHPHLLTSTHQRMLTVNPCNSLLMFSGFKRWVSTPTGQAINAGVLMPLELTNDRGDLVDKYPSLLTSQLGQV